jgi:hypothetical protein
MAIEFLHPVFRQADDVLNHGRTTDCNVNNTQYRYIIGLDCHKSHTLFQSNDDAGGRPANFKKIQNETRLNFIALSLNTELQLGKKFNTS